MRLMATYGWALLGATLMFAGCAGSGGGNGEPGGGEQAGTRSSGRKGSPIRQGAVVHDSSGLQITFGEFRMQPDGTAMVFTTYTNKSERVFFKIRAERSGDGLKTILLADDGGKYAAVDASGLEGFDELRLDPGGSSTVAFTFVPLAKGGDAAPRQSGGRYHMASSQSVHAESDSGSDDFGLSLAIRDMTPE